MHLRRSGPRSAPPVGGTFVSFVLVIVAMFGLVARETFVNRGPLSSASITSSAALSSSGTVQLGAVAATLFALAGLLCAYRAAVTRTRITGLIATVLLGPGAVWSWLAFVDESSVVQPVSGPVVVASAGTAAVLLLRGLRAARWLEVYSGLGSLTLALAALVVRADPPASRETPWVVLLAVAGGVTCLYGVLVELEDSEHRSGVDLLVSQQRLKDEIQHTEDLLHDLRSGLLSIEAAIGTVDSDVVEPVRVEAARLRRLTVVPRTGETTFDLVSPVRHLVQVRRAAGDVIELRTPVAVAVRGQESELMAIVENLLANARRHGRPPIVITISSDPATTRLSVFDHGDGVPVAQAGRVFDRSVSSHPQGTGIGLHRAWRLAKKNGAELVLETDRQGRTLFSLYLMSACDASESAGLDSSPVGRAKAI
jgi:signal transduction histidine kinase